MLSDTIKTLIRNAWDDGYPCLVATNGPQGPNITPKGSMIVFDDEHLAWWERSKRAVLENLGHDKRICVMSRPPLPAPRLETLIKRPSVTGRDAFCLYSYRNKVKSEPSVYP